MNCESPTADLEDSRARVRGLDDQEGDRDQEPAARPGEDERLAAMGVLQQEEREDNPGADGPRDARVDDERRWNRKGVVQTSSSSASSARSMMKRKRADASLPISSL